MVNTLNQNHLDIKREIKEKIHYIINSINHLKTILIHKFWVFRYCVLCDIMWQGIIHDLSKFSPTEFFESIKYYKGSYSPIDACKKENGYSLAWQHHKGRNKHHYEYWVDNLDNGGTCIIMPYKYTVEMLCDYLGAGRAYNRNKFTYINEWEWWNKKLDTNPKMHWKIKYFITCTLYQLFVEEYNSNCILYNLFTDEYYGKNKNYIEYRILSKSHLMHIYDYCINTCNNKEEFEDFLRQAKKVYDDYVNNCNNCDSSCL